MPSAYDIELSFRFPRAAGRFSPNRWQRQHAASLCVG